jgi:S-adenosylmethionine:tRNA ribosyltransferase-isomerase
LDEERYQTIWNREPGAVAAPTAGLHFTPTLLDSIRAGGVEVESVTLHIGAGTFQPIRVNDLSEHEMHSERYVISDRCAEQVRTTADRGGRIIAVGTTVVRALEAASMGPYRLRPGAAETAIFITPGFRFQTVDGLVTNLHLPESTLLMLVSAFGGYQRVRDAYETAKAHEYRFFSYGDAFFLERNSSRAQQKMRSGDHPVEF